MCAGNGSPLIKTYSVSESQWNALITYRETEKRLDEMKVLGAITIEHSQPGTNYVVFFKQSNGKQYVGAAEHLCEAVKFCWRKWTDDYCCKTCGRKLE